MKNSILIDQVNYFGELEGENYNGKVVYSKNGKFYNACIYICFYNKEVFFPKQPKGCKSLTGLEYATELFIDQNTMLFKR